MVAVGYGFGQQPSPSTGWFTAAELRRLGADVGLWVLVLVGAAAGLVGEPWVDDFAGVLPLLVAMVLFMFAHGARRYGWTGAVAFFAAAFLISNIGAKLFAHTGLRFGHYAWVHHGESILSRVPYALGAFYAAMGYLAWSIASVLLDGADDRLRTSRFDTVALPLVASFVMSTWDMVVDPLSSTRGAVWTWLDGSRDLPVPLRSFGGWWLTVYLVFQTFALYLRWRRQPLPASEGAAITWQPVSLYIAIGLSYIPTLLAASGGGLVGDAGVPWDRRALFETAMVISLFTMWFASGLAVIKLLRPSGQHCVGSYRS